jgi:hypothetical protein
VLNAVYEEDFLGFSYGFRPKRGQHDALDALAVGTGSTKVRGTALPLLRLSGGGRPEAGRGDLGRSDR